MKTTLNPFENAKRVAEGTGGASPAVIEEMQAEITDIKAQLTELAGAYSTTEHKTGRKWIDGRDIYEKTIQYESPYLNIATNGTAIENNTGVDFALSGQAIDPTYKSSTPIKVSVESGNLKGYAFDAQFTAETVTIEYVKPTV